MARPRGRAGHEEEVRRRLARWLHDDPCQRLAALGFTVRAVQNRIGSSEPVQAELARVGAALAELGEDLRRLSHDLHPALLERRGLATALRDQVEELRARHGVEVELVLPAAEASMPTELSLALYRIAQEGLANLRRHARATSSTLTLSVERGTIRLYLVDDGCGFDPALVGQGDGLGLASMAERARLLGGRLRLRSSPGQGTRLDVTVPRRHPGRWAARHRGWIASIGLILLALGGGLTAALLQARQAALETRRAEAAVRFLEDLFKTTGPRQTRAAPPDARELLGRARERLAEARTDPPMLRARLLDSLGGIHTELALYPEARQLLAEALALREREQGPNDPETVASLVRLGRLASLSGQGDAEALLRRALAWHERNPDRQPLALAEVLNDLGTTLAARSRFAEAEPLLRRSLALGETLFGPDDLRVAKLLHNLSGLAYYRGRADEAEALLKRALAIRTARSPADDLDLAGSREALALLYLEESRPQEAVELLEQLAASAERVWGAQHPELARTLVNLAMARGQLGQEPAALALLERAVAICRATLTADHPLRVRALHHLAAHQLRAGRLDAATPLYRQLLALREKGVEYGGWERASSEWSELQARLAGR